MKSKLYKDNLIYKKNKIIINLILKHLIQKYRICIKIIIKVIPIIIKKVIKNLDF